MFKVFVSFFLFLKIYFDYNVKLKKDLNKFHDPKFISDKFKIAVSKPIDFTQI